MCHRHLRHVPGTSGNQTKCCVSVTQAEDVCIPFPSTQLYCINFPGLLPEPLSVMSWERDTELSLSGAFGGRTLIGGSRLFAPIDYEVVLA